MKSTGIIRQIDHLGRIVIPKELRDNLGINEKDFLEIYVDGENIILGKHNYSCIFCGSEDNITFFKEKQLCEQCLAELTART